MDKWDNRQAGRTTKMLLAAAKYAASIQGSAIVVLQSGADLPYTGPIIHKIDPGGRWNQAERCYHLSDGGKVLFVTMKNPAVKMAELFVQGFSIDAAFFDHAAVKAAHNRALTEFHRYG